LFNFFIFKIKNHLSKFVQLLSSFFKFSMKG
jgi:hypothetical protein